MQRRENWPALLLVTILLLSLFGSLFPAVSAVPVSGAISSNTEWSGEILLSGDIYVEKGVILTVKPGTSVNADEYSIIVNGTLIATDSTFLSTITSTAGNHTTAVGSWRGIEVNVGGIVNLTRVDINNSKTALMVHGDAILNTVAIDTSYIGVEIDGNATIDALTCTLVSFECLLVSGTAVVYGLSASNVSTAVASSGNLDLNDASISDSGTALSLFSGSGNYTDIEVDNTSTAVSVKGITSVSVDDLTTFAVGLVIDAGDSQGFIISNISAQTSRAIRAEGLQSLTVKDSQFNGIRDGASLVDVNTDGTFTLDNVTFTNASTALDLRGSGDHHLTKVSAQAEDLVISATGVGQVFAEDLQLDAEGQGVRVSGPNLYWDDVTITGGAETTLGMRIATGTHSVGVLSISRLYSASDMSSLGLELIWATVVGTDISIIDFADGVEAESATFSCTDFSISNGRDIGITLKDSDLSVSATLSSNLHSTGALLEDSSSLHLSTWSTNLHDDVMEIGSDSMVTVRFLEAGNTASFDAMGDGTLVWGSNSTPNLAVSNTHKMEETSIKTVDLEGNPLVAEVKVEGFDLVSDASGIVVVPLRISGSTVIATSGSSGAQATLMGGVANQEIALPAIPDGNWTIPSGTHVVLGPSMDGQGHSLSGNLTIETDASLTLQDSTLHLMEGESLRTEGTGQLIGQGGILSGGQVNVDTQAPFQGQGKGLILDAQVHWNCSTPPSITMVTFAISLNLGDGCAVTLTRGALVAEPSLSTGSSLLLRNVLDMIVLDKGSPVEGATLNVGGNGLVTDVDGMASYTADSAQYTESGVVWSGSLTVVMHSSGLTDMMMWDSNTSLSKTFLASTVAAGSQTDWVILEAAWSPYYLASDLTIEETATMTIHDSAQLVVASDVGITLIGTLNAGAGTIQSTGSGSRWAGIIMQGAQAKLNLASTHVVEALMPLTILGGEVIAEGAEFARGTDGLIAATYSDTEISIILKDSSLRYGGQNCIKVAGAGITLTIDDSTMEQCGDHALWASLSKLWIDGLELGGGSIAGISLADVEGRISNLDARNHNGSSGSLNLSEQDAALSMTNLQLVPGTAEAALTARQCRWLDIVGLSVSGAPAIQVAYSAGLLSDLVLSGEGSGSAVLVEHNRGSGSLTISDSDISGYAVGLSLLGQAGDEFNEAVESIDTTWDATISISSDSLPFTSNGDTLTGAINYDSINPAEATLVNTSFSTVSATTQARVVAWEGYSISMKMFGTAIDAAANIDVVDPDDGSTYSFNNQGGEWNLLLPVFIGAASGSHQLQSAQFTATGPGSLPFSAEINLSSGSLRILNFNLTGNTKPTVHISSPDEGQRFSILDSIHFNGTATDAQSAADALSHSWQIFDSIGEVIWSSIEASPTWEVLEMGDFVVQYTVVDEHGLSSSSSVSFSIRYHDSDGDWVSTCDEEQWFDSSLGVKCGYDEVDDDDDNDGIIDSLDIWPLDPCADADVDNDMKPDVVNCPAGVLTELVEDDDVKQLTRALEAEDEGADMGMLVAFMLIIVGVVLVINRMRSAK